MYKHAYNVLYKYITTEEILRFCASCLSLYHVCSLILSTVPANKYIIENICLGITLYWLRLKLNSLIIFRLTLFWLYSKGYLSIQEHSALGIIGKKETKTKDSWKNRKTKVMSCD